MRRYFSALVLALLAATAVTVPAQAHAELKSSNPASGAALDSLPRNVELVFTGAVSLPDGTPVTITGPEGTSWPVTQVHALDNTITATIDPSAAKAGPHTIAWQAKADDGDTISGTIAFTLTVAGQPSSSAAPPPSSVTPSAPVSNSPSAATPPESGGVPVWVWIVVALVVVVGAILLVRRRQA